MSEAYLAKLRDPRWQRMRLEVMQRDQFRCVLCRAHEFTLHVHHLRYLAGHDPWEYDPAMLATLCEICHEMMHDPESVGAGVDVSIVMHGAFLERAATWPNMLSLCEALQVLRNETQFTPDEWREIIARFGEAVRDVEARHATVTAGE